MERTTKCIDKNNWIPGSHAHLPFNRCFCANSFTFFSWEWTLVMQRSPPYSIFLHVLLFSLHHRLLPFLLFFIVTFLLLVFIRTFGHFFCRPPITWSRQLFWKKKKKVCCAGPKQCALLSRIMIFVDQVKKLIESKEAAKAAPAPAQACWVPYLGRMNVNLQTQSCLNSIHSTGSPVHFRP